ncbi:MAG: hypothetical protein J0I09_12775 [Sphingobacteriia bacterium]|nr:hypothetical protein [Sphingobacteriia bacterium]
MSEVNQLPVKRFVFSLLFFLLLLHANAQDSTILLKDSLIEVKNWRNGKDTIQLNDEIAIKILTAKPDSFFNTIFINNIPVYSINGIQHQSADTCKKCRVFLFQLTKPFLHSLMQIGKGSKDATGFLKVNFAIGNRYQDCMVNARPIVIEQNQLVDSRLVIGLMMLIAIGLLIVLWRYNGSMIKDTSNIYYSLGRSQLLYWSLLFTYGYLFLCSWQGSLPFVPSSMLIILGISITTTAASRVVDIAKNDESIPQLTGKSQGFFIDILSDDKSISVQRFQNVIFNIIFGVLFIQKVALEHKIPDFDETVLVLIGISSGSYAVLKTTDPTNKTSTNAVG